MENAKTIDLLVVETIPATPHPETAIEIIRDVCNANGSVVYCCVVDRLPVHDWYGMIGGTDPNSSPIVWKQYLLQNLPKEVIVSDDFSSLAAQSDALLRATDSPNMFPDLIYGLPFKHIVRLFLDATHNIDSKLEDIPEDSFSLFKRFLWSSLLTFEITYRHLIKYKPRRLLIFNGRTPTTMPQRWAAKILNIKTAFHERGADMNRYTITDAPAIGSTLITQAVLNHSSTATEIEIETESTIFFERLRNKKPLFWHSFAKSQTIFEVFPRELFPRDYWTYLISTTVEIDADIDTDYDVGFGDQLRSLEVVARSAVKYNVPLYIRCHPNQVHKSYEVDRIHEVARLYKCILIPPNSEINTLALAFNAKRNFAYVTSLIHDLMSEGRAVGVVGRAIGFGHLEGCELTSADELESFIEKEPVVVGEFARKYGFYMATYGRLFRHFQATSLHQGRLLQL